MALKINCEWNFNFCMFIFHGHSNKSSSNILVIQIQNLMLHLWKCFIKLFTKFNDSHCERSLWKLTENIIIIWSSLFFYLNEKIEFYDPHWGIGKISTDINDAPLHI
jgi:hypothetical protein